MALIAGLIRGVTLLSGSPEGVTALDSTTVCSRRMYLVTVDFPAYTGASDTMTVTGLLTAIAAATRNGRTLVLRAAVPAYPGIDAGGQGVLVGGASVQALTLANTTTTGDITGNLIDASGTEVTSTSGTTIGVGVALVLDEQ